MNKLLILLVYVVGAVLCSVDWFPDEADEEALYNDVVAADYQGAVHKSLDLVKESRGSVVQTVVSKLVDERISNLLAFGYKLWNSDKGKAIVKTYFPRIFKLIYSQSLVKIINVRYGLALKLGRAVDELGDRIAYGDATDRESENIAWKFIPEWVDDRVYFKIFGIGRRQYLKVGVKADYLNDHAAYGEDRAETRRHQWYLTPVNFDGRILFFIYNRQYEQGLKLGTAVDDEGDRRAYSNGFEVGGLPEHYSWNIASYY